MKESKSGRFNGTVKTDEGPVTVLEGYAVIGDDFFLVSDDGKIVTDKTGGIVAVIENGNAQDVTPEIINQLRRRGYIQ